NVVDGNNNTQTLNITGTNNMKEVVAKINESAGGIVQASLNDSGKLVLTAQNTTSITIGAGTGAGATNAGTAANATTGFSLAFNATAGNSQGITVEVDDAVTSTGLNTTQADGSIVGADI